MRHFLCFTFVATSICFHSTADIERFIETWQLSDLTSAEWCIAKNFKLPKGHISDVKGMHVCEQLCCANIILTIRKRQFNLARRRCTKFISLLETAPEGFQPTYDWNWLRDILSDIEQISEILRRKRSEEGNDNISTTAQGEKATEKMPIKRSRSSDKTSIPEEEYLEEPVAKRRHFEKKPDPAQRIHLELPADTKTETMHPGESEGPRMWLPNLTTAEPAEKRRRVSSDAKREISPAQRIYLELPSDTQNEMMPAEEPTMELKGSEGVAVQTQIWLPVPKSPEPAEPTRKRLHDGADISTETDDEGYIHLPIPINFQKPAIL